MNSTTDSASTLALARRYRPQSFAQVAGQDQALAGLRYALETKRLHHCYLFSGTRGIGKTTLARLLARSLNCEKDILIEPCGECESCIESAKGHSLDLIEIDAASRTKVEDTRDLLDKVVYLPLKGRFKIYLIDEVHMLSTHSFNALLKTIEEPPSHVKFLLATTEPHKIPATILSRSLHYKLAPLAKEAIEAQLAQILDNEKIEAAPETLKILSVAASGSMRDALSLTDQAILLGGGKLQTETISQMLGIGDETLTHELLSLLLKAPSEPESQALLTKLDLLWKQPLDLAWLLDDLLNTLTQLAARQLCPTWPMAPGLDPLIEAAQNCPPGYLQLCYDNLSQAKSSGGTLAKHAFEMSLIRSLVFSKGFALGEARKLVDKPPTPPQSNKVPVAPEANLEPQAGSSDKNAEAVPEIAFEAAETSVPKEPKESPQLNEADSWEESSELADTLRPQFVTWVQQADRSLQTALMQARLSRAWVKKDQIRLELLLNQEDHDLLTESTKRAWSNFSQIVQSNLPDPYQGQKPLFDYQITQSTPSQDTAQEAVEKDQAELKQALQQTPQGQWIEKQLGGELEPNSLNRLQPDS